MGNSNYEAKVNPLVTLYSEASRLSKEAWFDEWGSRELR